MLRLWQQRSCDVYPVFLPQSPHSHIKLFQALRFIGLQPLCIIHSYSCTQSSNKNVVTFLKSQQLLWLHVRGAVYAAGEQFWDPKNYCSFVEFFYVVLSGSMGQNPQKSHNLPMSLWQMKTRCIDLYLLLFLLFFYTNLNFMASLLRESNSPWHFVFTCSTVHPRLHLFEYWKKKMVIMQNSITI